jgi:hypothetical protein
MLAAAAVVLATVLVHILLQLEAAVWAEMVDLPYRRRQHQELLALPIQVAVVVAQVERVKETMPTLWVTVVLAAQVL